MGNLFGFCKLVPCFCCCCIQNPYQMIEQGQTGIFQRLGKYVKTLLPGIHFINPCTDQLKIQNMKTQFIDLPAQWTLTKDNIMVKIDSIVYYHIKNPRQTIYASDNISFAVQELSISTFKTIFGQFTLQQIQTQRNEIALQIQILVEKIALDWGIEIESCLIKDIILTEDLQKILSTAAQECRLAQGKIIMAKSDLLIASLMRKTSDYINSDAAMHIRYLQTINQLAPSCKLIFHDEEQ